MVHTLLLADHSVTIRRVVELTFADQDVRVVAVSDGDQAIERLEAAPPDIVLADTGMPGTSGYDLARYVKQSPRLSHIPVLLLAGAFEPIDRARAEEAGCDGFLAKPFEPQLVISRVNELLARSRAVLKRSDGGNAGETDTGGASEPHVAAASSPSAKQEPATDQEPGRNVDLTRVGELDDYFDRLDAAFATRLNASGQLEPPAADGVRAPEEQAEATPADATPPDMEPSAGSAAASGSPALPALAEAFAALLAADRTMTAPSPGAASQPADDLVEQVARRVLAHLSDKVVRETVAEVAERLVREEIERIKAAIR
jgi:CheY-like chemotaxis protein